MAISTQPPTSDKSKVVVTRPAAGDRGPLSAFAALAAVGALILAAVAIIVVSTKDSGAPTASSAGAAPPVSVILSEFKISPNRIVVPQGGKLSVVNNGSQVHNLEIKGGPKTKDLKGGESEILDVSGLGLGNYEVICTIPGHADSGMKGTLEVVEKGGLVAADQAGAAGHDAHTTPDYAAMDTKMTEGINAFLDAAKTGVPLTKGTGNQKLAPTILADGTKQFELEAKIAEWEVEPGKTVQAWTYNGMVPSPWIRVEPNDKVKVVLKNSLPASTDIHFHGITTPFEADGVAPLTQPYIQPGETYTYEFTAPGRHELGMYHPHNHGHIAIPNGMFGIFQVGDVPLPEGKVVGGRPLPADIAVSQEIPMVLNDAGVIGLTLNGKGFPATAPIVSKVGEWVMVHYLNEGLQAHPMHLHHLPQLVIEKDGFPLEAPYYADTINVAPGERYTVLVRAEGPVDVGAWAYHCHILTHAENDNGLFGMVTAWVVQ